VQPSAGVILFRLVEESIRIDDVPGDPAQLTEPRDGKLTRVTEHLVFVEEVFLVTQLVSQMREHGS
jgi:hypothetical protein